jgi:hypothetical protein
VSCYESLGFRIDGVFDGCATLRQHRPQLFTYGAAVGNVVQRAAELKERRVHLVATPWTVARLRKFLFILQKTSCPQSYFRITVSVESGCMARGLR